MQSDVLSFGLEKVLQDLTHQHQPSLLWPGIELPVCLDRVPSPSVWERQCHSFDEFVYVLSGNCIMVLGDKAYPVGTGCTCIIPPGETHYETPMERGEDYKLIWMSLESSRFHGHETVYIDYKRELLETRSNIAQISDDTKSLLEAVYREAKTQKPFSSVVIKSYFTALIALLLRQTQQRNSLDLMVHPDTIVRAMAEYVEQHFADPYLTVKRIAAYVALSPNYFIEYIHKQTGMTPHKYLSHIRLEKAKQYLTTTGWPVNRISSEVGFVSPYTFSSTFKKIIGLSPKQYRVDAKIVQPFQI